MLCLKILRHHWICSIFVFSFFLFSSVFGLSPNSYATSTNCSVSYDGVTEFNLSDVCDSSFSSLNSSNYWLLSDWNVNNILPSSSSVGFAYYTDLSGWWNYFSYFSNQLSIYNDSFPSSFIFTPYPNPAVVSLCNGSYPCNPSRLRVTIGNVSGTLTFTLSDDFSGGSTPEPEPCPVCPEIPENPYDNKLDEIKKAIYACGAVILVLYFFFCIYKIIVKDGGSR